MSHLSEFLCQSIELSLCHGVEFERITISLPVHEKENTVSHRYRGMKADPDWLRTPFRRKESGSTTTSNRSHFSSHRQRPLPNSDGLIRGRTVESYQQHNELADVERTIRGALEHVRIAAVGVLLSKNWTLMLVTDQCA